MKHDAVLIGGKSTEMWDQEAGRHANRQHQANPGFRSRIPITQAEAMGKKGRKNS